MAKERDALSEAFYSTALRSLDEARAMLPREWGVVRTQERVLIAIPLLPDQLERTETVGGQVTVFYTREHAQAMVDGLHSALNLEWIEGLLLRAAQKGNAK